jgi:hypothetical protein
MSVNASLSRGRSLRLPASNTLKPPPSSQQQPPTIPGPSNIALFLTNLRLLDLDLQEDWPGITALTFSSKDAQQNLKKRIQCVEWALYQLFSIWDPEETRDVSRIFHLSFAMHVTEGTTETATVLPSSRKSTILKPASCTFQMSRPSEEEWTPWARCRPAENNAG